MASKLQVTASKLQVTASKLQVTASKLQVTASKLQVTSTKLQVTSTKLQVTRSKLTSLTAETKSYNFLKRCFECTVNGSLQMVVNIFSQLTDALSGNFVGAPDKISGYFFSRYERWRFSIFFQYYTNQLLIRLAFMTCTVKQQKGN